MAYVLSEAWVALMTERDTLNLASASAVNVGRDNRLERCPSCDGYGYAKDPENRYGVERYFVCKPCRGQGRVEVPLPRIVCWFSHGAASAVATKLTIAEHGHDRVTVALIDTGSEHPDNLRFRAEAEAWFDHPILVLQSEKYASTWDVWEQRRFLNGPHGALCTAELKKKVRFAFERPDDVQVFGYTADKADAARAVRFREQNPGVTLVTPLIERGLTKSDCLALVERQGIELPAMYRLGYSNNNCVPCVKGGIGYMNKIRRDFPDEFWRLARIEREIGHSALRENDPNGTGKRSLWLDELDPDRGNHADEPDFECGLMCAIAEGDLTEAPVQIQPKDAA